MGDRIHFNINENVWIKLTPVGLAELEREHDELNGLYNNVLGPWRAPEPDADGWYRFQMHDVMHQLGKLLVMGRPLPFETTIEFAAPSPQTREGA